MRCDEGEDAEHGPTPLSSLFCHTFPFYEFGQIINRLCATNAQLCIVSQERSEDRQHPMLRDAKWWQSSLFVCLFGQN